MAAVPIVKHKVMMIPALLIFIYDSFLYCPHLVIRGDGIILFLSKTQKVARKATFSEGMILV
jgi:hypothetical protein